MTRATTTDRKASVQEVRQHAKALRALVDELGVTPAGVRADGTLVVHTRDAGYAQAMRVSVRASELVGRYVHVITDDVPGAADTDEL